MNKTDLQALSTLSKLYKRKQNKGKEIKITQNQFGANPALVAAEIFGPMIVGELFKVFTRAGKGMKPLDNQSGGNPALIASIVGPIVVEQLFKLFTKKGRGLKEDVNPFIMQLLSNIGMDKILKPLLSLNQFRGSGLPTPEEFKEYVDKHKMRY